MTTTAFRTLLAAVALALVPTAARAADVTVFSTDFESGLPAEFSAPGAGIEGVQGYAGLGPLGYQFSGNFLRYTAVTISDTKLTLRGLPPHNAVHLRFLFGAIDSWDGTELFQVLVDGNLLFSHWFQLATGDASDYIAPPGALLSSGGNLGFSSGQYWSRDRAYNLAVEPAFDHIPHTADSLTVVWRIGAVSGPAAAQWQGGSDESWAIENVAVDVNSLVGVDPQPSPIALALEGARPNPASLGRVAIAFTLPSDGPARMDLYDLAGRRVRSRAIEPATAGRHVLDLAAGDRLAPGVYFVKLTQDGESRAVRMVVTD